MFEHCDLRLGQLALGRHLVVFVPHLVPLLRPEPPGGPAGVSLATVSQPGSASADAVSALQNLGFKPAEASKAVAEAQGELGADSGLDALVRAALKKAAK